MSNLAQDVRRALFVLFVITKLGAALLIRKLTRRRGSMADFAQRFRMALEELGVTYVKLGQYLAMRFDVIPATLARELDNLFESVSALPFEVVKAVIVSELGGPLEDFFPIFEPQPVAAASVAQVHRAYTRGNDCVAVKIQRPGIQSIFAADTRNLRRMATLFDALGLLGTLSLKEMAEEFITWTTRELDFKVEGETADRLRINALPYEVVPYIHWDLTTSRLLTMEFIDGLSLNQIIELFDAGHADEVYAKLPNLEVQDAFHKLAFASLRQLFITGFFHADPHPGNIFVLQDGRIAFIDFGIFGELDERQRTMLVGVIENVAVGNIQLSFRYYSQQMRPTADSDPRAFRREGEAVLRQWYDASRNPYASVQERHLGLYSAKMFDLVRRNHFVLNTDTLLFWRALNALDATALRFSDYASLDLLVELRQFFQQTRQNVVGEAIALSQDFGEALSIYGISYLSWLQTAKNYL